MPVKGKKKTTKKSKKSKKPSSRKVSLFDGYDMGVSLLGGPFSHTDPFGMMMPAPFPHPLMMPSPGVSIDVGSSDFGLGLGLPSSMKIDDGWVMKNNGLFATKPSGISISMKNSSTNPAPSAPTPSSLPAFTGGKPKKKKKTSKKPASKKRPGAKKTKKSKKKGHDNIY